jgi:hypothetical protein
MFLSMMDQIRSIDGFHRKASGLPFGVAILEPADAIAAGSERRDGFERKDAIRATAVGDHLAAFRKFAKASVQFGERNVESPRDCRISSRACQQPQ